MIALAPLLCKALQCGEPAILVTVARAKGSTPREEGATILVTRLASHGTIGGGQLEFHAIDVARVVEVVPRINLRRLPHAPCFLAGVFDYRGKVVPVVDLGVLLGSESCRDQLSTRIILVNSHPAAPSQPGQPGEADRQDTAATSGSPQAEQPREQRRWLLAGVLAGFSTAVGPVAVAIIPACAAAAGLELWRHGWRDRSARRALIALTVMVALPAFAEDAVTNTIDLKTKNGDVVIKLRPDLRQRLAESFETALRHAEGRALAVTR